jgi:hypothetical protein
MEVMALWFASRSTRKPRVQYTSLKGLYSFTEKKLHSRINTVM